MTLAPHNGSGADTIVHTGYEFVYCLQGRITYTVDGQQYMLTPGDSLLLESHLPHRWQNEEDTPAQMLLVLAPTDDRDRPTTATSPPPIPHRNPIRTACNPGATVSKTIALFCEKFHICT